MAWYKVISTTPVSVNYENGSVTSFPRGAFFEASPKLPDIVHLSTKHSPRSIAYMGEKCPDGKKGHPLPKAAGSVPPNVQPKSAATLPDGVSVLVKSTDRSIKVQ